VVNLKRALNRLSLDDFSFILVSSNFDRLVASWGLPQLMSTSCMYIYITLAVELLFSARQDGRKEKPLPEE